MKTNAIVSLADEKYFDLLIELIDSVKKNPESKDTAICILDAGLNDNQREQLKNQVDEVKKAEWDIEVSNLKIMGKEWLKSQVSRAFLPKYFPKYEKYFDLLIELIDSIKKKPESKDIAICVLDAGLNDNQSKQLKNKVDEVAKAEWDIEVSNLKVKGKEWLKSQVSRAFLPKYFPKYEKYLWIDCDAWVNDWKCVELYFKACEKGKLGITQTMGPGYKIMSKVKWLFGKLAIVKSQNFKHALSSNIDISKSRKLAFAPHINIGVFSLQKNSPCWEVWQKNLRETLKSGKIFGSEGLAINLSVYVDEVDTEFLPLSCNWIASNLLPKYDSIQKTFVEPYLPNNKIGIMHLAAGIWKNNVDMRLDKNIKIDIYNLQDKKELKSLRFNNN